MNAGRRALASALALVAVAAVAVAVAWLGIARQDEVRQARKISEERLFAFRAADVTTVVVEAKGETTRLTRDGDRWRIEAPVRAEGERATVDALVDRVADLRRKGTVADAAGSDGGQRYGLSRPRASVVLTLRDGKTETLALGDENPFDGTVFARNSAGVIALVPGEVRWALERGTFDLREKRVLPFEERDLQRVEVATPTLSYALAREGPDAWRLDAPVRERADAAAVERLLSGIRALRATAFRASAPAEPPAGATRRWTVTLTVRDRPPSRFVAWEAPPPPAPPRGGGAGLPAATLLVHVEGSSETATVPDSAVRALEQGLAALREKPPTTVRDARQPSPPGAAPSQGTATPAASGAK